MKDLAAALGLALAIEGLLCAAFPGAMRRAMQEASQSPMERMRLVGLVSAVAGVVVVGVVRLLFG
ncbi:MULTISPECIES: DUF2065 domain-containing protein [Methylobacterium]|uniref:DUF2065 domain-containing protein n=2 Tax=Methylobacterium TaxID=407 RepID=A0A0C6G1B1_9HYPH|nr:MULTISPECIES: DUF2065 domain-containing protein [Methylobacterium]MBK3400722.1 DUF2065 domain-containing protein [Methylobacterium ajmalii]MBK3411331.1 DUF2065 domain-containing protein [Methylobacterium ajmalii]MBK3422982.1 DUF2065 domain-containing protein [Methylobacterium ajmalii]MBZ6415495.1 DUF2065 domain-containing protein [Methylobacterium sp.]SEO69240.1 hypothetical protein SAMN04487843_10389 [Methylobacterium sp. ap11]